MCGITGAIGHLSPAIDRAVSRASDAMLHRGPDGSGLYRSHSDENGPGALYAHRRLAIIEPTESGRQPMTDADTGNVICFNGEIYNYRELRRELSELGARFATSTDTEVILKAYVQWGDRCLGRLRGMFAFALFDRATRRSLVARDGLGIKPLYYSEQVRSSSERVVLFASEVRALLAGGEVGRGLDPRAVATFVRNGFVVGPDTMVRGVSSLDAGSFMWVDEAGHVLSRERFWSLPSASDGPRATARDVQEVLSKAVEQHLISDVPLGVFLSGGIDSSAIAAMAVKVSSTRVRTFNIGFAEAELDESPWARRVATALDTEHHEIKLTQTQFLEQLPDALGSLDQPTFDGLNTYFVSRAAREAGLTVTLSGLGGDELFGGYSSFVDLPRARALSSAARPLPRALSRRLAGAVLRVRSEGHGEVPSQVRWGKLADVLAAGGDLVRLYQTSYSLFTQEFAGALTRTTGSATDWGLTPECSARVHDLVRSEPLLHAISTLELSLFVGERLLRDTDTASMANSLEVRVPLLDHELVETVARLPEELRYQPIRTKSLLRAAALSSLDPAIFERKKQGFVLPIDQWSRQSLRKEIESTLTDRALCEAAGLDAETTAKLWRAHEQRTRGIYWSRIWAIFVLLHWVRTHEVRL